MNTDNISFTKVETTMIMMPSHANNHGVVHGGELMKLMDNVAGIVAAKHSKGMAVTARADELVFHKSVKIGAIVTCIGQLAYVGSSSMQIFVKVVVNELKDYSQSEVALTAFFTYVYLENGKPAKVPKLAVTNDDEARLYKLGEEKYMEIKSKYPVIK